ncbi:uncharacterized protein [Amphiura filiformis]|uniref:uncharacterized protein n=1 Tax=Amphiura filiformis TaxID=82378 RepID=UPI003B225A4E
MQVAPKQQQTKELEPVQVTMNAPVGPSGKITQPAACKDFSIFLASSVRAAQEQRAAQERRVARAQQFHAAKTNCNTILASDAVPQAKEEHVSKKAQGAKLPAPKTDCNTILTSDPVPQPQAKEEHVSKKAQGARKKQKAKKAKVAKKSRGAKEAQQDAIMTQYAPVAPTQKTATKATQPPACKDFSIFLASSVRAAQEQRLAEEHQAAQEQQASIQAQSNSGQDSQEDSTKIEAFQQSQPASESVSFTSVIEIS